MINIRNTAKLGRLVARSSRFHPLRRRNELIICIRASTSAQPPLGTHGPISSDAKSVPAPPNLGLEANPTHLSFQSKQGGHQEVLDLPKLENEARRFAIRSSLDSYLSSCVEADLIYQAHDSLFWYCKRFSNVKVADSIDQSGQKKPVIDARHFNSVLRGFSRHGEAERIQELFRLMEDVGISPNQESHAYLLYSFINQPSRKKEISRLIQDYSIDLRSAIRSSRFSPSERSSFLDALSEIDPEIKNDIERLPTGYLCEVLKDFKETESVPYAPAADVATVDQMKQWAKEQLELEMKGSIFVDSMTRKSIQRADDPQTKMHAAEWYRMREVWRKDLLQKFQEILAAFQSRYKGDPKINMLPYLCLMEPESYIDAALKEIEMSASSEPYTMPFAYCQDQLGRRVMEKYMLEVRRKSYGDQLLKFYEKYIEFYNDPKMMGKQNPREFFYNLLEQENLSAIINHDTRFPLWPNYIRASIGRLLFDMIIATVKVDENFGSTDGRSPNMVPGFEKTLGQLDMTTKREREEIHAHTTLVNLCKSARTGQVILEATEVPMLCPPLPWLSPDIGGNLFQQTEFIRSPSLISEQDRIVRTCPIQRIYPVMDALNALSIIPWSVNKKVLPVALAVFQRGTKGDESFPEPLRELIPPMHELRPGLSNRNRSKMHLENKHWKLYWYTLSLANHFKDRVLWFHHHSDFRSRIYPAAIHFSHQVNDMARGLLKFAKKLPLGPRGLEWLKIHIINTTGFKKRDTLPERLKFAEENLELIIDSADHPLDGKRWWQLSSQPWQTLAACMELAEALRSPNPEQFMTGFPIHQDGTCNGLQHYAALGRDRTGAEAVNMTPRERPADAYSLVMDAVKLEIEKDAEAGNEIAKALITCIDRKIVKLGIMRLIYGASVLRSTSTMHKQLDGLDVLPEHMMMDGAVYLTQKISQAFGNIFSATPQIQRWLSRCALSITDYCNQAIEWDSPIGFPIIQPNYEFKDARNVFIPGSSEELGAFTGTFTARLEDRRIQKNAFTPNFIHSQEASHMMLTALHCQKQGIAFAQIHDCFWTHASTVDLMNIIIREQFVNMYSLPMLENVSQHFLNKYEPLAVQTGKKTSDPDGYQKMLDRFKDVPPQGDFDLNMVKEAPYFFG